jgi:FkbM family methyltransferase
MWRCHGRDQVVEACVAGGWQAFERPMPEVFEACLRATEGVVVDIGANTGFYTLLAAATRPDRNLWSVEPDPEARTILERNLQLNKLGDRVRVFPEALSDRVGVASLYVPTKDHGCIETSSSLEPDFKQSHHGVLQVPVCTLDTLAARTNPPLIGLIKIDVEGHEAAVLAGAGGTVAAHQPWIFIEVLPAADLPGLNGFLRDHGYVDLALRPEGPGRPGATIEFHMDAWNHLLLPARQAGRIFRKP